MDNTPSQKKYDDFGRLYFLFFFDGGGGRGAGGIVGDCLEGEMLLISEDWSTTRGEYMKRGELRAEWRDVYIYMLNWLF